MEKDETGPGYPRPVPQPAAGTTDEQIRATALTAAVTLLSGTGALVGGELADETLIQYVAWFETYIRTGRWRET